MRHGRWVETRDGVFVEGGWDGPFEALRFDQAATLAGSGGRLTPEGVLFAAPTHMLERLYSARVGDELVISNSLAFLLTAAGWEPDLAHPRYFFDLLAHYRAGVSTALKTITMANGRTVQLHDCVNVLVTPDGTVTPVAKTVTEPPRDYHEYVGALQRTADRVAANVADPQRTRVFRPLTTISRGYDSPAVSVLAARVGCREAVTFRVSGGSATSVDDNGTPIGDILGLRTTAYDRREFHLRPGLSDAEFYLNYSRTDRGMAVMEEQVAGSLLLTGRHGENFWSTDATRVLPALREPTARLMSGTALGELRLRIGFVHLPLPYSGAWHAPAIHRITCSDEMRPWWVGGDYDRPIARRLLEEAGVPRELFGRVKLGGMDGAAGTLSPASERDFTDFLAESRVPEPFLQRLQIHAQARLAATLRRLARNPRSAGHARRLESILGDRLHPMWNSRYCYVFHWGWRRIRDRYACPGGIPC